jgi:SMODS and SLOG-associating 2TM effector domain
MDDKGPEAKHPSIYADLLNKRRSYRGFYYFLMTVAIFAVMLQIALGLTISALSGTDAARFKIAIIVLGALNSFIGGVRFCQAVRDWS